MVSGTAISTQPLLARPHSPALHHVFVAPPQAVHLLVQQVQQARQLVDSVVPVRQVQLVDLAEQAELADLVVHESLELSPKLMEQHSPSLSTLPQQHQ